ncbi:MAG: PAS domain S-box protein [Candidatus Nanopelagicales bacterium]
MADPRSAGGLAEALGVPEAPLRLVLDTLLNPLILLTAVRDESGRVVDFVFADANDAACAFNRRSREDLVGTRLSEIHPAVRATGLFADYVHVVETGEPLAYDDWSYPQDLLAGEQRWYDVRAVAVGDGLLQTWRDVTHQHVGQQALISLDAAAIGMALVRPDGSFLNVNPAMCRMLGYSREELERLSFQQITHPEDLPRGLADVQRLVRGEATSFRERKRYLRKDGSTVWADLTGAVTRGDDGVLTGFVAQLIDVTPEVDLLEALQRSARQFQALAENATDVVYQTDTHGTIRWISPSVRQVLGWDPELLVGTAALSLIAAEDLPAVQKVRDELYHSGQPARLRVRFRTVDGGLRQASALARPIRDPAGAITGATVGLRDITEEVAAEEALARSEEQFRRAMDSAPQGMAITDGAGVVERANPALAHLLGHDPDDLVGHRLGEFLNPGAPAPGPLDRHMAGCRQAPARHEHRFTVADEDVWVDHLVSPLTETGDAARQYVHQLVDQTGTHVLRKQLEYRATHDDLTGLSNRGDLLTRLRERMDQPPSEHRTLGVVFCDVDNLKPINDRFGHPAGDAVLAAVASRLQAAVRDADLVGRFGGDEFLVVLNGIPEAEDLGEVAAKLLAAVRGTVVHADESISLSVSLGAVLAGSDDDPDTVLRRADEALYRAKQSGRDRVVIGD